MRKISTVLFVFPLLLLSSMVAIAQQRDVIDAQKGHEPPARVHLARGFARGARHNSNPNMLWHSGAIMPTAATQSIFWGTSWTSSSFVGDKITGLDSWYSGVGGSTYAGTSDEYTGSNGQVTSSINYLGYFTDSSAGPSRAPSTSTVLAEVCKVIPNPTANGYYPVYVDAKRGSAGYCAWHSYGSCGSTPVQFAFFFNLDGDAGCDPGDNSGTHSQGLAALANVSGHELSEARSDPRNGGWYDSAGNENGDKCAWTFGTPLLTFTNGSRWKIQGNWSNNAYNAGTGYTNSSGQRGCLDGGNYR
jgi:hypothetical protein